MKEHWDAVLCAAIARAGVDAGWLPPEVAAAIVDDVAELLDPSRFRPTHGDVPRYTAETGRPDEHCYVWRDEGGGCSVSVAIFSPKHPAAATAARAEAARLNGEETG